MKLSLERYWVVGLIVAVAVSIVTPLSTPLLAQDADTPAADEEKPADPYAVPDGTPAELSTFIQGILRTRPANNEERTKAIAAMGEAADKILAAKPTEAEAQIAVQVKTMFPSSPEELEKLVARLQELELPKVARGVRGNLIKSRIQATISMKADEKTAAVEKEIKELKKFLAEEPIGTSDIRLIMNAGRAVEMAASAEVAAKAYTDFAKLLAASEDEAVAGMAKRMEGVARRVGLVGKPMKVEGTVLGGEKLDWASLKGKVVLVDFWATWCGPCVAEIPNVIENYEAYHDKGFEIVGLSLDQSKERLETFVKDREIPWIIVYDEENPSPTPDYYGVMAIPTMILVGKDGNVISTTARGPQLDEELEKLFGPVKTDGEKDGEGDE